MELNDLIGKKIKIIDPEHYDGCIIEFEDGTKINLWQSHYPDGSYADTYFEELDAKHNSEEERE